MAAAAVVATAAAVALTPTDLMSFRPRYLNVLDCSFHYIFENIFRNLSNKFFIFFRSDILNLELQMMSDVSEPKLDILSARYSL